MKDKHSTLELLLDKIAKAKISQRDRFFLYALVLGIWLLRGYTELTLAKQLPDLVDWIVRLTGIIK